MFKFDLQENEKLVDIYRQTEVVLFKPVLIIFILIYFPWYFLLEYELAASFSRLLLFWTILVLFYGAYKYLMWLLNSYVITDRRLIAVSYGHVFSKTVTEVPLKHIQNISFSTKGFWQSLFGFGSVSVIAAGLPEPVILTNLKDPAKVKDFLWKIHGQSTAANVQTPAVSSPAPMVVKTVSTLQPRKVV